MPKGINIAGGQTLRELVEATEKNVWSKLSGFDPSLGYLTPENVCKRVGTDDLGSITEQIPFAFRIGGKVIILGFDSSGMLCEFEDETWGSPQTAALDYITDSPMAQIGEQVIIPTAGTDPKLMIYEPRSPSTKIRPLGVRSPYDYMANERPAVAQSAVSSARAAGDPRLFDCEADGAWTTKNGAYCTVDNSGTDVVAFTVLSGTSDMKSMQLATKSLGATGVDPTGKHWLVVDIRITGDAQAYGSDVAGLFSNDYSILPSGYELVFYSDEACSAEISRHYIPKVEPEGMLSRIALRLSDSTTPILGVSLETSSFFTKPTSGSTAVVYLYSEDFLDDWSQKSNLLLGAIINDKSPWALQMNMLDVTSTPVLLASDNLIANPSFEFDTSGTHWTTGGGASRKQRNGSDGVWSMELDNNGEYAYHGSATDGALAVDAGFDYVLEYDYFTKKSVLAVPTTVTVTGYNSSNAAVGSPQITTNLDAAGQDYRTRKINYTPAATVTHLKIEWIVTGASHQYIEFSIDNVKFYRADRVAPQSAHILQKFSLAGTDRKPGDPKTRYCYIHGAKNMLSNPLWKLQLSNPSDPSAPDTFADPWRTNTITITPPDNDFSANVIDEYGDYAPWVFVYRQVYNGTLLADNTPIGWGAWTFMALASMAVSITVDDTGANELASIEGRDIPTVLKLNNDFPSSARYALHSNQRVWACGLDWDNDDSVWKRPLTWEISSEGKTSAFPTEVNDESEQTDGTELDGYGTVDSEFRGAVATNEEVFEITDSGCYLIRGDNALQGYVVTRVAPIGGVRNTLADCAIGYIWHDGTDFRLYAGGLPQNISRGLIDSTLIDFTEPHCAVYAGNYYRLWCVYDGDPSVITYDLRDGAWRIRQTHAGATGHVNDSYNFVGICSDSLSVWGLNAAGQVVDLFGSDTTDYGADETVREAVTQHVRIAPAKGNANVNEVDYQFITEEASSTVDLTFATKGNLAGPEVGAATDSITITDDATEYGVNRNLEGNSLKLGISTLGVAPRVHFLGYDAGEAVAATGQDL